MGEIMCDEKKAVILAAGFGMRMVPINTLYTKGMLKVNGEPLVERLICQLHEAGIKNIKIVVGFMKEEYEYLIDKYNVKLIVNKDYMEKNNLHSLKLAKEYIGNSYIIPCDVWCGKNPFINNETESWYMVNDLVDEESIFRLNRKNNLNVIGKDSAGNGMVGIAYINEDDSKWLVQEINNLCSDHAYDDCFWEQALIENGKIRISAKVVHSANFVEINTYEQLRELDEHSDQLKSDAITAICRSLNAEQDEITDITVLKKGMTNRSFLFNCKGHKYIMRIPGEGTDMLINRREEAEVYNLINKTGICDEVSYIDPTNGYKITKYIEGARVCDPLVSDDLVRCMKKLKEFHDMKLTVDHRFDIFEKINFYEKLWKHEKSIYKDYEKTKNDVMLLKEYIDAQAKDECLTHIDAVPDNFLFAGEEIRLIDWEYAAMQDPHVDIAMFCIYAMYDREQVEQLIDIYFENNCSEAVRTKIYCYIAACGLLWSNWCEYKLDLGVEFGEYSLCQYRYAKEYFKIASARIS
ncbi:phosphotransferase [uncultured Ruminococcus sp.]|uniref:phosphotransferase n=1 Tax=uncultured Ruminococcus sp. TaxID=165186 RepID=UPI0025EA5B9F|nr:phosphotransferase [uncultured Ruminococcus sp.]